MEQQTSKEYFVNILIIGAVNIVEDFSKFLKIRNYKLHFRDNDLWKCSDDHWSMLNF